ncbi:DUF6531 domain-containing protein, partial [Rheinheimera soli]|uniref:DUF6531 domain-containing protein n=1 Tax=Rheinheimera soli TaxID=443616 RepID=UPI001E5DB75F
MLNKYSRVAFYTFLAMGGINICNTADTNKSDTANTRFSQWLPGTGWSVGVNKANAEEDPEKPIERMGVVGTWLPSEMWDIRLFMTDWRNRSLAGSGGGGGGGSAPENNPDDNNPDDDKCDGNPIMVANGEKVEFETDFVGKEQYPLEISRYYSSHNNYEGAFGKGWSSSFDTRLDVSTKTLYRGDGKSVKLSAATFYVPGVGSKSGYKTASGKNYLYQGAGNSWVFRNESDQNEIYDSLGRLINVSFSEKPDTLTFSGALQIQSYGISHRYSYNSSGKLSAITHSNGRKLTFDWQGERISSVKNNAGYDYQYSYKTNGMLGRVVFPDGNSKTYYYEDSRFPTFLTGVAKGNNRFSYFQYDSTGRAIESKHANETEKHNFSFTADTTTVTNPLGHKTTYFYDSALRSKLMRVEKEGSAYCAASAQATTYDTSGRKVTETDWNDKVTRYSYNDKNQVIQQINAYGEPEAITTLLSWHDNLNKLTRKTTGWLTERFSYDEKQNLLTYETLANGQTYTTTYTYTYHSNHLFSQITVTTPNQQVSTFQYDSSGNVIRSTDASGLVTLYSGYDALGQVGQITYPDGTATKYSYDKRGRITKEETVSVGGKTASVTYKYDYKGDLIKTEHSNGRATAYSYDAAGRLATENYRIATVVDMSTVGSHALARKSYDYDLMGNIKNTTLSDLHVISYTNCGDIMSGPPGMYSAFSGGTGSITPSDPLDTIGDPIPSCGTFYGRTDRATFNYFYDAAGHLVAIRNHANQLTHTYTYDGNGNRLTDTDAQTSTTTQFAYDALGRLIRQTDAAGKVTTFSHDARGLKQVQDARFNSTINSKNDRAQLEQLLSPDSGQSSFNYDEMGLLSNSTDARGITTTYDYDAVGRIQYKSNGSQALWTYDEGSYAKGKLNKVGNDSGSTSYQFNEWGLLSSQTQTTLAANYVGSWNDVTTWGYDAMGRVISLTYPG